MTLLEPKAENRERKAETGAKSSSCLFLLSAFCFLLFLPFSAIAQSKPDLLAVDSAFVGAQYEKAELLALRVLQGDFHLSPDERARLNLTMGYSAIMLGREEDARSYFARALDAVPDLELDPVQVSPKFRVVFDEVKAGLRRQVDKEDVQLSQAHSIRVARLSNLLVPGVGQWLEGRTWRGAVVFVVQAATFTALVMQANKMHMSRREYLSQTDPALIRHNYDRYNSDYKLTWLAGAATGLVYLAAQADLILLKPHLRAVKLALAPSANGVEVAIAW
jgi:hypothetical protein